VSAAAVWLRLFAAWWLAGDVVRNGAETGMWEPPDSRNEQQEMPVRTRSTGWLAWSLWGLTMVLEVAAIWLWLRNRSLGGGYFAPQVFLVPGFATVGAVIAARRANRVGWLFVGLGLVAALHALSMAYGERITLLGPGSLPAGSLANGLGGFLWPVNYLLFGLVLLLFPDGRLPSPRWRPAARLIVGSWCLSIIFNMLGPSEEHPEGLLLPQPALNLLTNLVNIAALVGLVVMMAAPFLRFRQASYHQRQQLKWVAYIALLSMLAAFAGVGLSRLLPAAGVLGALGVLGIAVGIPVAVAVAILRHRLYDIDRLINRTLVYGLLTAILGLGYAGVVLILGEVFGGIGTEPPSWAVAGATLAMAALFQPARRRIQTAVDRRFNRRKYNAATTIEIFSARLRDQVDLDTLTTELLAVTDKTMQPTTVSLWLRPPDEVAGAHAPRWDY
jgi:hypothetical protein